MGPTKLHPKVCNLAATIAFWVETVKIDTLKDSEDIYLLLQGLRPRFEILVCEEGENQERDERRDPIFSWDDDFNPADMSPIWVTWYIDFRDSFPHSWHIISIIIIFFIQEE